MKKLLLASAALFTGFFASAQTVTTVGFTFSPDTITILEGQTVTWTLTSVHNAVEVSQATWQANGNTSNGGFTIPFGGGSHMFPTQGTYYYVCGNHNLSGMKGVVIVEQATSVDENKSVFEVAAYPTRVIDFLTVKVNQSAAANLQFVVVNLLGEIVYQQNPSQFAAGNHILSFDLSHLNSGAYFVKVIANDKVKTIKIVK